MLCELKINYYCFAFVIVRYWMYVTILEGREKHAYVVTNDLMRDHKLAFMEPRPFSRWRMTHVVNFDLTTFDEVENTNKNDKFFGPGDFDRIAICIDSMIRRIVVN